MKRYILFIDKEYQHGYDYKYFLYDSENNINTIRFNSILNIIDIISCINIHQFFKRYAAAYNFGHLVTLEEQQCNNVEKIVEFDTLEDIIEQIPEELI